MQEKACTHERDFVSFVRRDRSVHAAPNGTRERNAASYINIYMNSVCNSLVCDDHLIR